MLRLLTQPEYDIRLLTSEPNVILRIDHRPEHHHHVLVDPELYDVFAHEEQIGLQIFLKCERGHYSNKNQRDVYLILNLIFYKIVSTD